MNTTNFYKILH